MTNIRGNNNTSQTTATPVAHVTAQAAAPIGTRSLLLEAAAYYLKILLNDTSV